MVDNCFVYIIGCVFPNGIGAPVKVGISRNVDKRLSSLRTSSPQKLHLVAEFFLPSRQLAVLAEGAFHEVMGNYRTNGEWFDIPPLEAVRGMWSNIDLMLGKVCEFDLLQRSSFWTALKMPSCAKDLDDYLASMPQRYGSF